MSIEIFSGKGGGAIRRVVDSKASTVYFTLAAKAGNDLKKIFMGAAPALSVNVIEAVDYDLHKALNSGYVIVSFGYAPVKITMDGVDIWADMDTGDKNCNSYSDDIKSWWDRYNLQADPEARVDLGLYGRGGTTTYSCVVTNISRMANANVRGIGSYQLSLLGVRKQ